MAWKYIFQVDNHLLVVLYQISKWDSYRVDSKCHTALSQHLRIPVGLMAPEATLARPLEAWIFISSRTIMRLYSPFQRRFRHPDLRQDCQRSNWSWWVETALQFTGYVHLLCHYQVSFGLVWPFPSFLLFLFSTKWTDVFRIRSQQFMQI